MAIKETREARRSTTGIKLRREATIKTNIQVGVRASARIAQHKFFESHLGHDEEEGGHKKSHYDEADSHSEHHEGGKKEKGGKHGHKKYHKKGSKTTGYHKKANKDEYHKEHKFYDDKHEEGKHKVRYHRLNLLIATSLNIFL